MATAALACDTPKDPSKTIVAIRSSEPFTYLSSRNHPEGFAVNLWNSIEYELIQNGTINGSEIVFCNSIGEQETALENGSVDVVVSPLTITADRMGNYDFSQQYLASGLTLAIQSSNAVDFNSATKVVTETVTQPGVARALLFFLILNLVVAFLIRLVLKTRESSTPYQSDPSWLVSVKYMLEAVVRTAGLKGVSGDFESATGKILEIFMAVVGTALSATIFGILTSAFVGAIGETEAIPATDLSKLRVATLYCSTSQEFLRVQYQTELEEGSLPENEVAGYNTRVAWLACDQNANASQRLEPPADPALKGSVVLTPSWADAVKALAAGEVDVVLGDWVALSYQSRRDAYQGKIDVQPKVYKNEPYGWAITRTGDVLGLRRAIDRALIEEMRDPRWRKRIEAALGTGAISPN